MKLLLGLIATTALFSQCRAAELTDLRAQDIRKTGAEMPAPAPAAGLTTYRSSEIFSSRTAAVNAMMNSEANLLKTGVPVFEKRTLRSGSGYTFEIAYLSSLRQAEYLSRETFGSAAAALNAAMNAEASLLKAGVPVAEIRVTGAGAGRRYELRYLASSEPKVFSPSRTYGSKAAALNGMYNTESRLLTGKVGPLEKRVLKAGDGYSFEIWFVQAE
ncbi:MAG: hypothetical protein M0011_11590 [Elusimicrobia bacterium]|nr:hypothetical protein [Elusimicrobiota bacterium]